jgi:phosphoribosyl 1,2-cyclic phosphate phosphodiesterase
VTAVIGEVELLVLGSGTSSGVPVIGCDCGTCTSDDPRDRRLRTSAAVRFRDARGGERLLLIDASPDLREQALRHRIRRCDAILFTHNHVDHVWGLDETRRFNVLMQEPITVHADQHTMESLFRVYQHIFRRETNVNDSFVASLEARVVDEGVPVDLHGLRCTPLRMLHGRLPVLAWRMEALDAAGAVAAEQPGPLPLVWATDVSGIPPESWPGLGGLRTLFLDMLRPRAHPTHFTVDEAIAAAERIGAGRTWFIHMTHDIRHAELDPRLPAGMRLAWDGLVVG